MAKSEQAHTSGRGRPRKDANAAPTPDQLRRLRFIERAALWTGRVGRNALATTFDLSVNHVSLDLQRYRSMAPENLVYDVVAQCYRPSSNFQPLFGSVDCGEVLNTIAATVALPVSERERLLGFSVAIDVIRPLPMTIEDSVLLAVLRGLTAGHPIEMIYQSLTTAEPVSRTFSPLSLIFTGLRWLVRGWDTKSDTFRDFALARIISAEEAASIQIDTPRDVDWHEKAELELSPVESLSISQREVVIREYGMALNGGVFSVRVSVRKALVPYMLDYMRLRPNEKNEISPIYLRNYTDIAHLDRASARQ